MTAAPVEELNEAVEAQIARMRPRDIAVGVLTYNNADTIKIVAEAAVLGLEASVPGTPAAFIDADAGSSDGTPELLMDAGLATVVVRREAPVGERLTPPFHGVPGRGTALHATFSAAHRLGARALVLLEADVTSITADWIARLARPVLEEKADLVTPAYVRHRYDGTITNLLLAPLVRALYGRRLRQPLGGQQALSGRLVEHLLVHPRWNWRGPDVSDLWVVGTAIADGFAVWEAWLGPHTVRSRTRTSDLPGMVAQTVGSTFAVMDRHQELWREVRGSEPLPAVGEPVLPSAAPMAVDVDRMIEGFRLGLRDLTSIWENILAPDTLADVLSLDTGETLPFVFPDDLWARVVYDFALGHHYGVVHREHLLRSLVPLYLGRTAAYVLATRHLDAAETDRVLQGVGAAFERQKPYLVEQWR
jgi:hypothetical protein